MKNPEKKKLKSKNNFSFQFEILYLEIRYFLSHSNRI